MPGSLVLVQETTVSSGVSSVSLTGIDSTYDVYKVVYNNLVQADNNVDVNIRFINSSGSDITSSEYDRAQMYFRASTTFLNRTGTNQAQGQIVEQGGNNTNEQSNGILYIFNANNSSEFTFYTNEGNYTNIDTNLVGGQGGGVLTSAEQVTGVTFFIGTGNITAGTFKLYGLKK